MKLGFAAQSWALAIFSALSIVAASAFDRSLRLTPPNIGLFQHPAIWTFFGLQIALPLAVRQSLVTLLKAGPQLRNVTGINSPTSSLLKPIVRFLRLQTNEGRLAASVVYFAGLVAFVWNTYQNQRPYVVVPYDFWDSKSFTCGFWVTRFYKFYLFVWLLPYVSLIHVGVVLVSLRLIRHARRARKLVLTPFHTDGAGGLGFIPGLITRPINFAVMLSAIPTGAAFSVHRSLAVTPLIGSGLLIAATLFAYLVPILFLGRDIQAVKQSTIEQLRALQERQHSAILALETIDSEGLHRANEALDYFDKMCLRVKSISTYPHLGRLLGWLSLAMTPSVLSLALKIYDEVLPLIHPPTKPS